MEKTERGRASASNDQSVLNRANSRPRIEGEEVEAVEKRDEQVGAGMKSRVGILFTR